MWITRRSRLFIGLNRNGVPVCFTFSAAACALMRKFLDAQRAVIVGIERNARMIVGVQAQHFLRDQFEREQQLGAIGQQQIDVARP